MEEVGLLSRACRLTRSTYVNSASLPIRHALVLPFRYRLYQKRSVTTRTAHGICCRPVHTPNSPFFSDVSPFSICRPQRFNDADLKYAKTNRKQVRGLRTQQRHADRRLCAPDHPGLQAVRDGPLHRRQRHRRDGRLASAQESYHVRIEFACQSRAVLRLVTSFKSSCLGRLNKCSGQSRKVRTKFSWLAKV